MRRGEARKGWFEANLEDAEFRRLYAREEMIEGFLHQVEEAMEKKDMSRQQLAEILGCSAANVTRIMRRTSNLTAATMADLATALDLRARVYLEPTTVWSVGRYLSHVAGAQQTFDFTGMEAVPTAYATKWRDWDGAFLLRKSRTAAHAGRKAPVAFEEARVA